MVCGGSDGEIGVGVPDLIPGAEHRRGASEKKERLKEHISGMDFTQ